MARMHLLLSFHHSAVGVYREWGLFVAVSGSGSVAGLLRGPALAAHAVQSQLSFVRARAR